MNNIHVPCIVCDHYMHIRGTNPYIRMCSLQNLTALPERYVTAAIGTPHAGISEGTKSSSVLSACGMAKVYILHLPSFLENTPMGNELKKVLKEERSGHILGVVIFLSKYTHLTRS